MTLSAAKVTKQACTFSAGYPQLLFWHMVPHEGLAECIATESMVIKSCSLQASCLFRGSGLSLPMLAAGIPGLQCAHAGIQQPIHHQVRLLMHGRLLLLQRPRRAPAVCARHVITDWSLMIAKMRPLSRLCVYPRYVQLDIAVRLQLA